MKTIRGALLLGFLAAAALTGCAGKRNYHWSGCRVTRTWTDQQGQERKDCDCLNGKQIGTDAKTRAVIIRCE